MTICLSLSVLKKNSVTFCLFDTSNQFFNVNAKIYDLNAVAKKNIFLKVYNYFIRVFRFQRYLIYENPDLIISFTESANFVSILSCIFAKRRKGDVPELWADCKEAEKNLEWKVKHNLDDMLLSAWNWEKNIRK